MLVSMPTEAQFLKKLKDKVQNAAENKVTDKTADKTSEKVDKGMDDIFSIGKKSDKSKKGKKENGSDEYSMDDISNIFSRSGEKPRATYQFAYLYDMKVNASGHEQEMSYFLNPNSDYFGMRMDQNDMKFFAVFDHGKKTMFNFVETSGQKIVTGMGLDFDDLDMDDDDEAIMGDYKIANLPNRTFLGYDCKGKQIESQESIMKVYYSDKVPIDMRNIMNSGKQASKGMVGDQMLSGKEFRELSNSLILYMENTTKKNGEKFTLEGVNIEKINHNFNTSDYMSF